MTQHKQVTSRSGDLMAANRLMIQALSLLDAHDHLAAAYLDQAIVRLELRPAGEGMPPEQIGS